MTSDFSIKIVPAFAEHFPQLARLWLEVSQSAHSFIEDSYWASNVQAMESKYLPASTVDMICIEGSPVGFIAMVDDYLAALFVAESQQGKGYGKKLLDHAKKDRERITLNVFAQNESAVAFYRKQGFDLENEQIDEATGEREFALIWRRT